MRPKPYTPEELSELVRRDFHAMSPLELEEVDARLKAGESSDEKSFREILNAAWADPSQVDALIAKVRRSRHPGSFALLPILREIRADAAACRRTGEARLMNELGAA